MCGTSECVGLVSVWYVCSACAPIVTDVCGWDSCVCGMCGLYLLQL